ncbi:MAG: alpha/beta fold hydrolase, partial [Pseudomonadota bacterium]
GYLVHPLGRRLVWLIALAAVLGGCISDPDIAPPVRMPALVGLDTADPDDDAVISTDGTALAMTVWQAASIGTAPNAILIAVHGMNDYAHAFAGAGAAWSAAGLTVYAYDQRSFGRNHRAGSPWPGTAQLVLDLQAMVTAVRAHHPGVPVFVLGHSMGGALAMAANRTDRSTAAMPLADGVILAAPAIWGGARMPLAYRMTLSIAATFAPGKTLTGARAARQSTDNIPILRGMQADPFVVKETPLRTIAGLVRLMGRANQSAHHQQGEVLFLMGCRDELVPVNDLADVARTISDTLPTQTTMIAYPAGWHLLFRDLQAHRVWTDVADWVLARTQNSKPRVIAIHDTNDEQTGACAQHR